MVKGIHQVVPEVDDQDRALAFWIKELGFELAQDVPYGNERWVEVRTPDKAATLVPSVKASDRRLPRACRPRTSCSTGTT